VELKDGVPVAGPDLSVTVNGLKFPNPFVIGSGPPGTNYTVMKKAFDEGWGGVIAKTVSLNADLVKNVTPRYAKLKSEDGNEVIGWQNIELISDRSFEVMLAEFKQLKEEYPDRILIASIMDEYKKENWVEIVKRCEEVGVDAFEINFSCPHGMPERKMGAAMGQDCSVLDEVCGWVNEVATVPVWAKMTPNITDITEPARVCLEKNMDGIAAINTIMSIMGVNLDTLAPEPCVEGHSTPGGYSYKAVRPIALAKCMAIAQMIKKDFPDRTLSGIGGVDTGGHAAEFILLGSDTVQVCTGVMIHGYPLVQNLCAELQEFMGKHGFESIAEFKGMSLDYFTTHTDLVARQKEAIEKKKKAKVGIESDDKWTGEGFVAETESMVSNNV
jgi:dihydropyrimidine dehydrogenase (NADP+)